MIWVELTLEVVMPAPKKDQSDVASTRSKIKSKSTVSIKTAKGKHREVSSKTNQKNDQGGEDSKIDKAYKAAAAYSSIKSSHKNIGIKIYESQFDFSVYSQWPDKLSKLEDAPELLIFKRPPNNAFGENSNSFLIKFLTCSICKNKVHALYGLSNFKPLVARTDHTIEYVERLVGVYSKNGLSPTVSLSTVQPNNKTSKAFHTRSTLGTKTTEVKQQLLGQFYQAAHIALQYLANGVTLYKQMILSLSFTRYSEEELTSAEIKMTSGKSVIGSCMWVITYALQQLQEDPDVEYFGLTPKKKVNPLLFELAAMVLEMISLSFHAWAETVRAIGVLERIHRKTEVLFHKQTLYLHTVAQPNSEDAIAASAHLKRYRRSEVGSSQLSRFDPPNATPQVWNKKINAVPRIIYKTDYANSEGSTWRGFDPLGVKDKVHHLMSLLKFVQLILESVKDSTEKLVLELQGQPGRKKQTQNNGRQSQERTAEITCYEDGIEVMDELLTRGLAYIEWDQKETREFFEVDKIFLDDMDCLTLGAGITRAILHDARHTMHICYETNRLVNLHEFMSLPEYVKVYKKLKENAETEALNQRHQQQRQSSPGTHKKLGDGKGNRSSSISNPYDIEELKLELKNVAALFRTSPYLEIVKTLPIYCSQVGITLQDAELVFTPSSEKLLSKSVPAAGRKSDA